MLKQMNKALGRMSRYDIDIKEKCYFRIKKYESTYQKRIFNKSYRRLEKQLINEQRI